MLLQVQDRKYWSRPTPTTMCVHYVQYCTKVQNILHNVHYHLQKKYRIFCTRRTNIYKKVQNIEVHKYTILLLLCSVHTSLLRPLVQCAMHYKSTNNIVQKHAKDTSFLRYDNVLLQISTKYNTAKLKSAKYKNTKSTTMNSARAQSRGWAESALLLMRRLAGRGREGAPSSF